MATFEKMAAKLTVALLLLSAAFTLDQAEAVPSRLRRMPFEASQQDSHAASPGLNWSGSSGTEGGEYGGDAQVPDSRNGGGLAGVFPLQVADPRDHQSNRRLGIVDGFAYTYRMDCGSGATWNSDDDIRTDACGQPQCVRGGSHELESC